MSLAAWSAGARFFDVFLQMPGMFFAAEAHHDRRSFF
jgi:hypothetical protein